MDGKAVAESVATFSTEYAPRATGTPGEVAAGDALLAEAERLGYETENVLLPPVDGAPGAILRAVVATKKGHGESDEAFEPLLRHINFNVMGLPEAEGLVEIVGVNQRNSDERSWDILDYPSLRWAGMRAAADYPAYHMPDDTIETIDMVAGGRTFFEQGLRNTLVSSYLTTLALDNEMPVAKATATGTGPISFSAAGTTDPDGPPGTLTWTFGDGTTATGATVTHTYAKAGSYTARLDVADNLWPAVTSSVRVPVTVTKPATTKKPAKKASCKTKARKIKNAKKRKRALKRCAKKKKKRS